MVPPSKRAQVYFPGDGLVPLEEATNILFQSNVEDLQQAFLCPRRFKFMLPEGGVSALAAPPGSLAIYQDHFSHGIRHGLVLSLEVFFRSMQLNADVLGWYEFTPRYHYALVKLEPFCPLWRRRIILVVAPDWPMNTTPRTPVVRLDPAQLTGLSMLQADFLESLVLFYNRAPIPDFESVVNLESLEDHQIAPRRHPRGGPPWLNYLYRERDNLWRLGVRMLLGGGDLSDAESCSGAPDE
ncbi:hypothetical protein Dimus_010909 [Dionaea muscipula]